MRVQASPLTAVVLAVLAVLAVRTSTTEAPTPLADTAIPDGSPAGGSRIDVDTFDPCSPFRSTLWLKTAVVDRQLAPQAAPEPGAAAGGGLRG